MRFALAFLLLASAALPAEAQTTERFRLERNGDGFVRIDTQTGAVSTCTGQDGQLVCRMSADERQAWEAETDGLRAELEKLEARVSALESRPSGALPTEQDIDKTLDVARRLLRGFAEIVEDLRKPSDPPAAEPPDRL